jgi:hypothetical protein
MKFMLTVCIWVVYAVYVCNLYSVYVESQRGCVMFASLTRVVYARGVHVRYYETRVRVR